MARKKIIEIVLDTETTGLDYTKEKMVEFAAVRLENGKIKDEFQTLINPEQWLSYPLIHIVGNEGVTLNINDQKYQLTSIDGEVFIDSEPEKSIVYHDLSEQGMRNVTAVFPDHTFPILNAGENKISITGNYKSATIIPRWRTLC